MPLPAPGLAGYGSDPRCSDEWFRQCTRAGVSAACWSFAFGVPELEKRGLRMIDAALAEA